MSDKAHRIKVLDAQSCFRIGNSIVSVERTIGRKEYLATGVQYCPTSGFGSTRHGAVLDALRNHEDLARRELERAQSAREAFEEYMIGVKP